MKLVNSNRLEQWYGKEWIARTSRAMQGFRYPVPILGQQRVVVYDGDFYGTIKGGYCASLLDYLLDQRGGFSTFTQVKENQAQSRTHGFNKSVIVISITGSSAHYWAVGTWPVAGSNAAGPPGGTVRTNTTTGAFPIGDAPTGKTMHLKEMWAQELSAAGSKSLMLFDCLFGVNLTATAGDSAVTGVPTRYQTSALAPGNFITARVTLILDATATNITITYVDQDGNTAEAGSAQAIDVATGFSVNEVPFVQPQWFYNLNAGDTGVRNITNINFSVTNTGDIEVMIGHAIGIAPCLQVGQGWSVVDGVNSNLLLDSILNGACLAVMSLHEGGNLGAFGKIIIGVN